MRGWQHTSLDYDPTTDGDEEEWARTVAAEGWRTWHSSGVWVTIGNRRIGAAPSVSAATGRPPPAWRCRVKYEPPELT